MALQLSFDVSDKITTIRLSGSLNENSSALDGVEVNPVFDLHLDLRDLKSINSLGIRNFRNWIFQIRCQRLKLFYCPRIFVNQLNLVDGFVPPKTEIESFFTPYYSEVTGEKTQLLFTKYLEYKYENGLWKLYVPKVEDSQGNEMELDVMREQYFRFLSVYKGTGSRS
ncbi:hypothetical protein D3C87_109480 [compost metagenome]